MFKPIICVCVHTLCFSNPSWEQFAAAYSLPGLLILSARRSPQGMNTCMRIELPSPNFNRTRRSTAKNSSQRGGRREQ